ncbi:MAG: hypothetical protein MUF72_02190 [Elainella sp. Prado103]|jgi:hypothetical protein|nr:hypothetical protein [Elainella sp. Prado103]
MFFNRRFIAGAATMLLASVSIAQPGFSYPDQMGSLLSQANVPPEEGIPQLSDEEVEGRITKIDGDRVELRLSNGELRTYTISEADQTRNRLTVGSEVVLSVRGDTVLAISPAGSTPETTGTARSGESSSSSSSSSSTVIRRETTVQQTRPAPAAQPAPQPAPEPQPVRGLW